MRLGWLNAAVRSVTAAHLLHKHWENHGWFHISRPLSLPTMVHSEESGSGSPKGLGPSEQLLSLSNNLTKQKPFLYHCPLEQSACTRVYTCTVKNPHTHRDIAHLLSKEHYIVLHLPFAQDNLLSLLVLVVMTECWHLMHLHNFLVLLTWLINVCDSHKLQGNVDKSQYFQTMTLHYIDINLQPTRSWLSSKCWSVCSSAALYIADNSW